MSNKEIIQVSVKAYSKISLLWDREVSPLAKNLLIPAQVNTK